MLERALAMAYTGDARVITKDLMGPFGLKRSLIENGLPSICNFIEFQGEHALGFSHLPTNWPLTKDNRPAFASKRAQTLTYSLNHFQVCISPPAPLFISIEQYFIDLTPELLCGVLYNSCSPCDSNQFIHSRRSYAASGACYRTYRIRVISR
jgi:hypothetical protein